MMRKRTEDFGKGIRLCLVAIKSSSEPTEHVILFDLRVLFRQLAMLWVARLTKSWVASCLFSCPMGQKNCLLYLRHCDQQVDLRLEGWCDDEYLRSGRASSKSGHDCTFEFRHGNKYCRFPSRLTDEHGMLLLPPYRPFCLVEREFVPCSAMVRNHHSMSQSRPR